MTLIWIIQEITPVFCGRYRIRIKLLPRLVNIFQLLHQPLKIVHDNNFLRIIQYFAFHKLHAFVNWGFTIQIKFYVNLHLGLLDFGSTRWQCIRSTTADQLSVIICSTGRVMTTKIDVFTCKASTCNQAFFSITPKPLSNFSINSRLSGYDTRRIKRCCKNIDDNENLPPSHVRKHLAHNLWNRQGFLNINSICHLPGYI